MTVLQGEAMKIYITAITLSIFLVFVNFVYGQEKTNKKDLPNFDRVNEKLFRGGQPTENGIKTLAGKGVKTIIDLRGEDKISQKEKLWAENTGLKFISISLQNWFRPKTSDIENILAEINRAENQPVYLHCRRGADRTGTVMAIYRIKHDNWTVKQALDEAEKYDMGWWQFWMKDYVNDYYKHLKNH